MASKNDARHGIEKSALEQHGGNHRDTSNYRGNFSRFLALEQIKTPLMLLSDFSRFIALELIKTTLMVPSGAIARKHNNIKHMNTYNQILNK